MYRALAEHDQVDASPSRRAGPSPRCKVSCFNDSYLRLATSRYGTPSTIPPITGFPVTFATLVTG
jgi:hypothetical protein